MEEIAGLGKSRSKGDTLRLTPKSSTLDSIPAIRSRGDFQELTMLEPLDTSRRRASPDTVLDSELYPGLIHAAGADAFYPNPTQIASPSKISDTHLACPLLKFPPPCLLPTPIATSAAFPSSQVCWVALCCWRTDYSPQT